MKGGGGQSGIAWYMYMSEMNTSQLILSIKCNTVGHYLEKNGTGELVNMRKELLKLILSSIAF